MRVIVFSSKITVRRLTASLAGKGVELVNLSEMGEAITLLKQERFDLVVVDSLVEEADTVCRCIVELGCVPVVLMVDKKRADWGKLQSLGIHGYLLQGANGTELAARLHAIARRCLLNGVNERGGGSRAKKQGGNVNERKGRPNKHLKEVKRNAT